MREYIFAFRVCARQGDAYQGSLYPDGLVQVEWPGTALTRDEVLTMAEALVHIAERMVQGPAIQHTFREEVDITFPPGMNT